jgi:DNA-binding response OmpR family regulator/anti-sigma regulatory factor (Ser/Thr protein kinase)
VGDVVSFLKNLVDSFTVEAGKHKVELNFESNVPEKQVEFAASAFEKILVNLVSNALKYNKPGGKVEVWLQLHHHLVELTVKDTGIGMSKKQQERVFERFYRIQGETERPGFGIGLSVVKELVDLMQGKIQLDSTEGIGTTITVTLPVVEVQHNHPENDEVGDAEASILVVEDDEGIYEFIKEVLGKQGLKTTRGLHGSDGFNKALEVLPDMVVTDIMMPVEDGISMTQRLKQHILTQHIPVMMLSAKQSLESRLQGIGVGADLYLPKPFNPDELWLLVKNTLQTLKNNREKYAIHIQESIKPYNERVAGNDGYLKKVIEVVDAHIMETDFSVNELADALYISRSQLHRKITSITGYSTTHFIRIIRLEKARDLLESNTGNITEIAYECGFNSQSYFTRSFTEHFGKSPSEFLKHKK